MISVERLDPETWKVTVEGRTTTTHTVTLNGAACRRLGGPMADPEHVVVESFHFLLEREPNTAILSRFDLPVIGRYFPEYESELRRRLGAA